MKSPWTWLSMCKHRLAKSVIWWVYIVLKSLLNHHEHEITMNMTKHVHIPKHSGVFCHITLHIYMYFLSAKNFVEGPWFVLFYLTLVLSLKYKDYLTSSQLIFLLCELFLLQAFSFKPWILMLLYSPNLSAAWF